MSLKKKLAIAAVIIVLAIVAFVAYSYFQFVAKYPHCQINSNVNFDICTRSSRVNRLYSISKIKNPYNDYSTTINLVPKQSIAYKLNFSAFILPDSYRACFRGISLSAKTNQTGLYNYDPSTGIQIRCVAQVWTSSNHYVSDQLVFPCLNKQFPILEVYIFPSSFTGTTIYDFMNNLNVSEKIFSLQGDMKC